MTLPIALIMALPNTNSFFRYLEYSLDGNMTLENVQTVWKSINHPVGARTGFQFLRLNWDRIFATYEEIFPVFSTIFLDFVSQLSTEIDLEDVSKIII